MSVKFARVQDLSLVEFIDFDPTDKFHPDLKFIPIPEEYAPYVNTSWTIDTSDNIVIPFEQEISKFLVELANFRYAKEVSGITVNSIAVATDRDSRAALQTLITSVSSGFAETVNYKTKTGFVSLTLSELKSLSKAQFDYVQACFAKEGELADLAKSVLESKSFNDLVDLLAVYKENWPSTEIVETQAN